MLSAPHIAVRTDTKLKHQDADHGLILWAFSIILRTHLLRWKRCPYTRNTRAVTRISLPEQYIDWFSYYFTTE